MRIAVPKEEVYDEKIRPLMTQIIEICREHKIANVCSFCLGLDPNKGGQVLACTTAMVTSEFEPDRRHVMAAHLITGTKTRVAIEEIETRRRGDRGVLMDKTMEKETPGKEAS